MALEGIRVVGPSGGRERRRRRRKSDSDDKKIFDDALKDRLDSPEAVTEIEIEIEIDENGEERPQRKRGSRWWRPDKSIDFVV